MVIIAQQEVYMQVLFGKLALRYFLQVAPHNREYIRKLDTVGDKAMKRNRQKYLSILNT